MSGQRQPIELVIANGKKHLTKTEIEERKSKEVKAPSDKVKAPSYLPSDLKKEFNKLAKELKEIDIISNLDIDSLARFVIAKKMYIDLTTKILEDSDLLLDKDIIATQDKLFKQCRSAATDLGLTISSRCKLVVPKKQDEKPTNKFTKFGSAANG